MRAGRWLRRQGDLRSTHNTGVAGRADSGAGTRRSAPRARKRFGQHFLEPAWVTKVVDALQTTSADTFVEIGPGRGAITIPLAARVRRLIAIEIDRDLASALPSRAPANTEVICGDVLAADLPTLLEQERLPVRVAGNLPYNVSSPILFKLLEAADDGRRIRDATVMLQREVADRLMAPPGGKDYGVLAIQMARAASVERLLDLPPGAFRPPPKVKSTVVRLRFHPAAFDVGSDETFVRLVRGVFLQRRKTLANALRPVAASLGVDVGDLIDKAGVDGTARPETLSPADFGRLSRAVL